MDTQQDGPDAVRERPVSPRRPKTNKRVANGLLALGSAAVIAVYAAGYAHTAPAAASLVNPTPIVVASTAPTAIATATATIAATVTSSAPLTQSAITAAAAATATAAAPTEAPSAPTATTAAPTATRTTTTSVAVATAATTGAYRDGTYTGSGTSRHGGVTVVVVIKGGKIVSAEITTSNTRYPISRIAALPGEVVANQSASIGLVSGATDSSTAFTTAVRAALAQAK